MGALSRSVSDTVPISSPKVTTVLLQSPIELSELIKVNGRLLTCIPNRRGIISSATFHRARDIDIIHFLSTPLIIIYRRRLLLHHMLIQIKLNLVPPPSLPLSPLQPTHRTPITRTLPKRPGQPIRNIRRITRCSANPQIRVRNLIATIIPARSLIKPARIIRRRAKRIKRLIQCQPQSLACGAFMYHSADCGVWARRNGPLVKGVA